MLNFGTSPDEVGDNSPDEVGVPRQTLGGTSPDVGERVKGKTVKRERGDACGELSPDMTRPAGDESKDGGEGAVTPVDVSASRAEAEKRKVFKQEIVTFWCVLNARGGVPRDARECSWGIPGERALTDLIQRAPGMTVDTLQECLRNRVAAVQAGAFAPALQPSRWLRSLPSFEAGPINEYGDPLGRGKK